jgi:hypothetical protein
VSKGVDRREEAEVEEEEEKEKGRMGSTRMGVVVPWTEGEAEDETREKERRHATAGRGRVYNDKASSYSSAFLSLTHTHRAAAACPDE